MSERDQPQGPDPLLAIGSPQESFDAAAYAEFARLCESGEPVALVTVVNAHGSAPRGMGAAMIVRPDGSIIGSVGGGELELRAIEQAQAALRDRRPRLLHYDFSGAEGRNPLRNLGMACAGTVDLFVQPSAGAPALIICGAGHIACALAPMAVRAGFQVTVLDNRIGRPDPADFPAHARLVHGRYEELLAGIDFDAETTYVVIVTHGHANDEEILLGCLDRPWKYMGMIGSTAKVAKVSKDVANSDATRARFARVHAPIGLDLGGRSPGEIAVAILGEMLAIRHGREEVTSLSARRRGRERRAAGGAGDQP